jgi:hypothetical protein
MSRSGAGDTVFVKPSNNIYTALAAFALVVVIMGCVAIWMRSEPVFGPGGLFKADNTASSSRR